MQNVVRAVADRFPGYAVHVLAFHYPYRRGSYRLGRLHVHALGGRNRKHVHRLVTWWRAWRTFNTLRRTTQVRAVHSFWLGECALLGQWLHRRYGLPHVASVGGQEVSGPNPYLRYLDLDTLTVTAGSAFAGRALHKAAGRSPDAIIPLGLDVDALAQIERPAIRDIDVLGVGSLSPVKRFDVFLDVLAGLAVSHPHLRACLIGDGPERPALEAVIQAKGLAHCVTLLGALPRQEVFRYMLRSRFLLHTAAYESQAYVFLEALYAGLRIVRFDVGYTGETDRVQTCASPEEMTAALRLLWEAPPPPGPAVPIRAEESAEAFARLYGLG